MDIRTIGKLGIGAGTALGIGGLALGVGRNESSPRGHSRAFAPQASAGRAAHQAFGAYDRGGRPGITANEATRVLERWDIESYPEFVSKHGGDTKWRVWEGTATKTGSVQPARRAADRNHDGVAAWKELNVLAKRFDRDGQAGLGASELRAFRASYGATTHVRNDWTSSYTYTTGPNDPYPDTGPSNGTSDGDDVDYGWDTGTSTGDDDYGTGTSSGDDDYYGTSRGDD